MKNSLTHSCKICKSINKITENLFFCIDIASYIIKYGKAAKTVTKIATNHW